MKVVMPRLPFRLVRDGHHHDQIAAAAVRDELLRAVDYPAVPVANGGGPHGARIAP
jgi:hypothetical protein